MEKPTETTDRIYEEGRRKAEQEFWQPYTEWLKRLSEELVPISKLLADGLRQDKTLGEWMDAAKPCLPSRTGREIVRDLIPLCRDMLRPNYGPMPDFSGDGDFHRIAQPVKLIDLVHSLENALGKRAVLDFQAPQPGDVSLTWADISKARRLLGFEPRTSLASGLERFLA